MEKRFSIVVEEVGERKKMIEAIASIEEIQLSEAEEKYGNSLEGLGWVANESKKEKIQDLLESAGAIIEIEVIPPSVAEITEAIEEAISKVPEGEQGPTGSPGKNAPKWPWILGLSLYLIAIIFLLIVNRVGFKTEATLSAVSVQLEDNESDLFKQVQGVARTADRVGITNTSDLNRERLILKIVGKEWSDVPESIAKMKGASPLRKAFFERLLRDFLIGKTDTKKKEKEKPVDEDVKEEKLQTETPSPVPAPTLVGTVFDF